MSCGCRSVKSPIILLSFGGGNRVGTCTPISFLEEGPCCWMWGMVDSLAPEMEKKLTFDIEELNDIQTWWEF